MFNKFILLIKLRFYFFKYFKNFDFYIFIILNFCYILMIILLFVNILILNKKNICFIGS